MLIETNEKELILWIGSLEKLEGGFLGFAEFVGHAAAEIQDDADGNRHIFGGKIHNFLLDVVLEDAEVVRFQPRNYAVIRVGDGDVDEGQIYVYMKGYSRFDDLAGCVALHVVSEERLGGDGRAKSRADGAKKQKKEDAPNR